MRTSLRSSDRSRATIDDRELIKIATYDLDGVNDRLPVMLQWLAETRPDIGCLQELKAPHNSIART